MKEVKVVGCRFVGLPTFTRRRLRQQSTGLDLIWDLAKSKVLSKSKASFYDHLTIIMYVILRYIVYFVHAL